MHGSGWWWVIDDDCAQKRHAEAHRSSDAAINANVGRRKRQCKRYGRVSSRKFPVRLFAKGPQSNPDVGPSRSHPVHPDPHSVSFTERIFPWMHATVAAKHVRYSSPDGGSLKKKQWSYPVCMYVCISWHSCPAFHLSRSRKVISFLCYIIGKSAKRLITADLFLLIFSRVDWFWLITSKTLLHMCTRLMPFVSLFW